MTVQIRQAWETNSSSSHSLVLDLSYVDESNIHPTIFGSFENNCLTVIPVTRGFGWQWEIWDLPIDKLTYLLIDGLDETRAINLLKTKLKINRVILPNLSSAYDFYIDHDSEGTSREAIALDDDALWQFIIGPSQILGGNDNEEGPW